MANVFPPALREVKSVPCVVTGWYACLRYRYRSCILEGLVIRGLGISVLHLEQRMRRVGIVWLSRCHIDIWR